MSNSWLTEGTAHRSAPQRTPVIHLLVQDPPGVWVMWCSYGKGREDNPYGNRLCGECRALARDAAKSEMLDDGFERWL